MKLGSTSVIICSSYSVLGTPSRKDSLQTSLIEQLKPAILYKLLVFPHRKLYSLNAIRAKFDLRDAIVLHTLRKDETIRRPASRKEPQDGRTQEEGKG